MAIGKTVNMRVPMEFKIAVKQKKANMESDLSRYTRKRVSIPMTNVLKTIVPVMRTRELDPDDLRKLARRKVRL